MERWKLNLAVLWVGTFLTMAGMSMIIPFISLYIKELGITDPDEISLWAGLIFSANFITAFLFQPLWGKLSDRFGRKIMLLRSGFGMSIVIILMGLATNVWHLLLLRLLNGTVSGFIPAANALVAANTPKERSGFAMGTLQSGSVSGSVIGPFMGGLLADWFGFRIIFFITGSLLLSATILSMIVVREKFNAAQAKAAPNVSILTGFRQIIGYPGMFALFTVTFVTQLALSGTMPLMPVFIEEMHGPVPNLAFYAGLVSSVTGFSNVIFSPLLGRVGDRFGSDRVLRLSLICAGLSFIPQAFVHSVWQLMAVRFLQGMFIGGLLPSVNALIRRNVQDTMISRAFSFNQSFLSLGNLIGPTASGILTLWMGIRGLFILSAVLMIMNALWVGRAVVGHIGPGSAQ
jgi:MFS family permease